MKTITTLNSPIFRDVERRQRFSGFVGRQAKDFKDLTKRRMKESTPTGRTYRHRGKSHRASARGQRPAIESGTLLNSIQDKRLSEASSEVTAGAEYAKYLQSQRLNRPIMSDTDAAEAQRKMTREGEQLIVTLT